MNRSRENPDVMILAWARCKGWRLPALAAWRRMGYQGEDLDDKVERKRSKVRCLKGDTVVGRDGLI